MIAGGLDTGWTFYTPYSTGSSHYNVVPTMIGVVIAGFSSLLTGLEFHRHDPLAARPGMTWCRLPIFVWTMYATSFIFLLAVPGAGDGADAGHGRAACCKSEFSIRRWAAIRSCSSTCSGSIRIRPCTS